LLPGYLKPTEKTMLETIAIEHPDTPGERMIIYKSDFNPEVHKPYEAPKPEGAGEDSNAPHEEGGGETEETKPKGKTKK
jgi:hypothetical protein